ncbi:hypothetical protein H7J88_23135 [Mycolicibacterium flavescens]|uniref:Lipoprotein LpqN n=1 Tax=Mycolicibacterium flavescens TaxID=1776 RepID=A0A1E3RJX9_MYCFV|nr:hypothetical protein [Mycolicibacterium flavescens]MCV7282533.1 hypothetical protein [Mycolicibacterium flavescens]ODQ90159.1 hypothetical protein BHQ18_12045 [Mycolicibacterium flavescens]
MSEYRLKSLSAAVTLAALCAAAVGCEAATDPNAGTGSPAAPPSSSSVQAAPTTSATGDPAVDYGRLLLTAADVSDDEDTFTVQSTNPGPDGLPGASALFVNQDDTRAIADTIVVYPDAETASRTLRDALPSIGSVVAGATPRPVPVGTDGTLAVGTSPDGAKAATLLVFTRGPALVRLEFQSALGDATTDSYVITVGKMQEIALRTGLPD